MADNDTHRDTVSRETTPTNEKSSEDQPYSHGFFDKDPASSEARKTFLKIAILGAILITITIWGVLAMYWGALWKTENLVYKLNGWVVDFDGGVMGSTVTQYMSQIQERSQMSWAIKDPSEFPNGPIDLAHAVSQEKCWVGIAINPSATKNLNSAISAADATYNGTLAVTVYTNEGRNENGYSFVIVPAINIPLMKVMQMFAELNAKQIANSANLPTILAQAPSAVTRPMGYTIYNLHPFDIPEAAAVDFVGLIYLLIISFIIANQLFNARMVTGLNRRLTTKSLILLRVGAPVTMYFFISLVYSLLSEAFQVDFNRKFGHSGFVIYWMMSFCGMSALGLALEAMVTLLTLKFVAFFLVLWIITNVSVSFYPIELLPSLFAYGYAMPFYNVSRTVRTILFSTRNQVGLNFGVQLSWVAVSLITLPLIQWLLRRREIKAWQKEHDKGESS